MRYESQSGKSNRDALRRASSRREWRALVLLSRNPNQIRVVGDGGFQSEIPEGAVFKASGVAVEKSKVGTAIVQICVGKIGKAERGKVF